MSIESMGISAENDEIVPCRNAEEYAIEWLEKHGGPASPSELAEEYDCTPGHMQDVLRESDSTTRVEIGEYALSTETSTGAKAEAEDTLSDVDRDDFAGVVASDDAGDEERETAAEGGDEEESNGPNGIPVPVPPNALIIAAAVVIVIAWLQFRRSRGSTSPNQNEQRREDSPFIER